MRSEYFEVRFRSERPVDEWPENFAVITGYATTGETWSDEENEASDRQLRERLESASAFVRRLTGYSPTTGHAEPGWAVEVGLEEARNIGREFKQDAVYYVSGDDLNVSRCGADGEASFVDSFRCRLDR